MDETYFLFLKFNKNFSVALGISYFEYAYCFLGEGSPLPGSVGSRGILNPRSVTRNSDKDRKFLRQGTTKTPRGESILDKTGLDKAN